MPKTRIGERLSAVTSAAASTTGRSHEVPEFNQKFEDFTKTFKPLTTALKNHHSHMQKLEKTEGELMEILSKWVKDTPIATTENNAVVVQEHMLKKDEVYTAKYVKELIEYLHEWELVVKTRVEATQKQVKEMKVDLEHYEKKVDALAKGQEIATSKGKNPSDAEIEKLKRNEEKLALAKGSYESQANRLCDLIEAVVDNAWKDMVPFLLRLMKMENELVEAKKEVMESSAVIQNLQNLAEEYKIDLTTPAPAASDKAKTVPKQ